MGALTSSPASRTRYLARAGKLELFARLEALLYRLQADVQLLRVSRAYSLAGYVAGARAVGDPRHRRDALLDAQLEHDRRALAAAPATVPELYLAVALPPPRSGLAALWPALAAPLGLRDARTLSERALRDLQVAERRAFERVDAFFEAERASTEQIQWLVRRAYCRGLGDPPLDARHRPQALELLADPDDPHPPPAPGDRRASTCTAGTRRCSSAACARCAPTPSSASPTRPSSCSARCPSRRTSRARAELLFAPLERLGFPVDACLHARWLPNRDAVALARRRRADAENFFEEEAAGVGAPSSEAIERPAAAQELEHRLTRPDRPPLLRADVVLSLGAPDEATLDERVERVRTEYGGIALHRPHGEQHRLFLSTLPAQRAALDDYADYLLPEQVAAMMPRRRRRGRHRARPLPRPHAVGGSPARLPRSRRGVPALAPADRADARHARLRQDRRDAGARLPRLDARLGPDRRHRPEGRPPLGGAARRARRRPRRQPRARRAVRRRPLRRAARPAADRRAGRARGPRLRLPRRHPPAAGRRPPGRPSCASPSSTPSPPTPRSCAAVLARARGRPGRRARVRPRARPCTPSAGLARLGFADPDRPPPDVGARDIVSLRIRHLRLPPPGRARGEPDEEERVGAALLRLLAAYALRLTATDTDRHSVVCIDEAWALLEHAPEVVERLSRLGRSQNVTPILASQLIGDVDALDGLVGTCFVFGLDSDAEAAPALRLLRQDPDDEPLRRRLLGFRRGRCLMLDAYGRLIALQVEHHRPGAARRARHDPGSDRPRCRGRRALRPPPRSRWCSPWRTPGPRAPTPRHTRRPRRRPPLPAPDPLTLRSPLCAPGARAALGAAEQRACARTGSPLSGAPTTHYAYDIEWNPSITHPADVAVKALYSLLDMLWLALLFAVRGVLTLLDWAFTLNPFALGAAGGLQRALARFFASSTPATCRP